MSVETLPIPPEADIIDLLESLKNHRVRPKTTDGDADVLSFPVRVPIGILDRTIAEIKRLREAT
jgi:hypothetical protein